QGGGDHGRQPALERSGRAPRALPRPRERPAVPQRLVVSGLRRAAAVLALACACAPRECPYDSNVSCGVRFTCAPSEVYVYTCVPNVDDGGYERACSCSKNGEQL